MEHHKILFAFSDPKMGQNVRSIGRPYSWSIHCHFQSNFGSGNNPLLSSNHLTWGLLKLHDWH